RGRPQRRAGAPLRAPEPHVRSPRPMSAPPRLALGLLSGALLSAYVLAPKLTPPTLSVVDVQLLSSDLWEQHLKVRMHVQNPNDRTLPIKGLEYTLEVEGQQ